MQLHRLIISLATLVLSHLSLPAQAHDARIGSIHVIHPAAPATLPGQRSGAIYLSIENEGKTADRLLSLRSPAGSVAIHKMTMDDNIMKMREVDSLPLPPAAKVVMKADGSHHLMLTGLKQPLAAGDEIPLTLTFERAGTIEVSVHVGQNAAQKNMEKMGH
ncbi:MAG: copper chaperone PCu(A)C [Herminiimonas sp.]|nr:copper chaperone PCu(A)C [Herminiimonas sp.]